jgi:ATP-dependent helicase/nuclease subunit B
MVLSRLAEYIGSPWLARQGKAPLPPLFELAAVQYTARTMVGKPPLGDIAGHPRLHQSLLITFRELELLSAVSLDKLAATDELRDQIIKWYKAVKDLTSGYYTGEDLARAAAEAVSRTESAAIMNDLGYIILYLNSSLSPSEMKMAVELLKTGKVAVICCLTGEEDTDRWAKKLAHGFDPVRINISETIRPVQPLVEHVAVAQNYQEEVKWIIRHLLKKAETGVPFHRMAILYREPYPYAGYIRQQLRHASIPAAGPSVIKLKNTPPGKLLIWLLEVLNNGLVRDECMHWIAEAPVRALPANQPAQPEMAKWEIISRNAGIVKGPEQWRSRLAAFRNRLKENLEEYGGEEEASPSELNGIEEEIRSLELLQKFIEGLAGIEIPASGSSYRNFTVWALNLLKDYAWDPDHWPEEGQKYLETIEGLIKDISRLDELIPDGTTLEGFKMLINTALEATVGRIGATGSGVLVAPVSTVGGMNFETVYITGMSEGAFPPRLYIDPLLPDSVRRILSAEDSLPLSLEDKIRERRHYLNALAAGKTVVLTFSRTDPHAERGQYASPWFLAEVEKLLGRPVRSAELENLESRTGVSVVLSAEHAISYAASLCPLDEHDYNMASLSRWKARRRNLDDHYLLTDSQPAGKAIRMERARQSPQFTTWDGNLTPLAGNSRLLGLPGDRHFSPTRLERWAGCPLRYYFEYILKLPVYEKPEEIVFIDAKDRGSLVHGILDRFMRSIMADQKVPDYGEPWNGEHEKLLLQIAREEFEKAEQKGITGQPMMWVMAREDIEQDLITFLAADSEMRAEKGLKPFRVEQSFGMENRGTMPPVKLCLAGQDIYLHGFVDRIDVNRDKSCYLVIDYKTGSDSAYSGMGKDPLQGGKRLQLPVYGLAVQEAVGTQAEIITCYWFISSRGNFRMREVFLPAIEEEFKRAVNTIAAGITQGIFPANPGESGSGCDYCDFDRICPPDRDLLWEKKYLAPELRLYRKLNERDTEEEVDG